MHKSVIFLLLMCSLKSEAQSSLRPAENILFDRITNLFNYRDTSQVSRVYDRATGQWVLTSGGLSPVTFDSILKPVFGKVMLGSADLVNQGSAYALTVNQYESKFSLNYSWMGNKEKVRGKYYNVGLAASSSSKLLPVFSKDEWQQGITFTFGLTQSYNNTLSYSKERDFVQKRRRNILLSLKDIYSTLLTDTSLFDARETVLDSIRISDVKDFITRIHFNGIREYENAAAGVNSYIYLNSIGSNTALLNRYVDSCIASYEIRQLKNIGYSFWWYNLLLRPEYKGVSIYDTTAARIAGIEKKEYIRIGIDFLLNYVNSKDGLFLLQVGSGFRNSNYLEGRKPDDIEFLKTPLGDTMVAENAKALVVGDYTKYRKGFVLVTPVAGFNWFFGKKRTLGWETFLSAKMAIKSKEVPFDNLFSFRSGLLISMNGKSDLAKSTFGLLAQWEDLKFNSAHIGDGFSLAVRIGIPFNF